MKEVSRGDNEPEGVESSEAFTIETSIELPADIEASVRVETLPPVMEKVARHEESLAKVYLASPETVQSQRPKLWEIIDAAIGSTANPLEQEEIKLIGGILDWQYFGRHHDTLPAGLVIVAESNGRLTFDTRIMTNWYHVKYKVMKRFRELNLGELEETLEKEQIANRSKWERLIKKSIEQSSAYNFMQSFDIKVEAPRAEQPLGERERWIRESAIERQARVDADQPQGTILRGTPADRIRRPKLAWLDFETISMAQEPQSAPEALTRAKAFFIEQIKEYDETISEIIIDPNPPEGLERIRVKSGEEEPDAWSTITDVACLMMKDLPIVSEFSHSMGHRFLEEVIEVVLLAEAHSSFESCLEEAVKRVFLYRIYPRGEFYDLDYSFYGEHVPRHLLLAPVGEVVERGLLEEAEREKRHSDGLSRSAREGMVNAQDYREMERNTVGILDGEINDLITNRLLQAQPLQSDLPAFSTEATAFLTYGPTFRDYDPYIPGYVLVSKNDYEFGFALDPEGDPQVPVEVPLDAAQKEKLARKYAAVGLKEFAAFVLNEIETVEDLKNGLVYFGEYLDPREVPTNRYEADHESSYFKDIQSLDDLERYVQNGKLRGQCVFYSDLLKLSLQEIFGPQAAARTEGFAIKGRRVSQVGHAKTVFTHEDKTYLIDATPASDFTFNVFDELGLVSSTADRHAPPRARLDNTEIPPRRAGQSKKSFSKERYIASVRIALETQLSIALGVPNQTELYEKIASFAEADPILRTVRAAIDATKGIDTREERERLIRYLKGYQKLSVHERQHIGLPSYDDQLMTLLLTTAHDLEW